MQQVKGANSHQRGSRQQHIAKEEINMKQRASEKEGQ
jgi:hypothetical protein